MPHHLFGKLQDSRTVAAGNLIKIPLQVSKTSPHKPLRKSTEEVRLEADKVMNPLLAGGNRASSGFGRGSQFRLSYITPPPDLRQIPSEVSVPFKNLLKRDSITKQKALEDIVAYIKSFPTKIAGREQDGNAEDIPDSALVAWVRFHFPGATWLWPF